MTALIPPGGATLESAPTTRVDVRRLLHEVDPYAGFDAKDYPFDPQGWNGTAPLFGRLIGAVRPRLVVEVGSWQGQSAITMGRHLRAQGLGAQLVCVDTWLGATEFWLQPGNALHRGLRLRHGYPSVYYQFLANVCHAGLTDVIVPFPAPSTIAARVLLARGVRADLVYIDASHEENDVWLDLAYWWQALRPGGVMFGDDYHERLMPGVTRAVQSFFGELGLRHAVVAGQHWVVEKPRAG